MERCQTLFLAFGICIFITVIYLLSSSKRIGRSPPLEEQIIMKDEKVIYSKYKFYQYIKDKFNILTILSQICYHMMLKRVCACKYCKYSKREN